MRKDNLIGLGLITIAASLFAYAFTNVPPKFPSKVYDGNCKVYLMDVNNDNRKDLVIRDKNGSIPFIDDRYVNLHVFLQQNDGNYMLLDSLEGMSKKSSDSLKNSIESMLLDKH
ncbi:MAG: hypothetical protein WC755_04495 [Candidatus Woesearchaeota archaeon]|jgi:hypothetical protein